MFGAVILGLVGIALLVIGYLIWKKEKITLLHDYHYEKVSEGDKKAFCTISGIGIFVMGVGLLVNAVIFGFTESLWSFLALALGFAVGISLLIYAGKKYNTK